MLLRVIACALLMFFLSCLPLAAEQTQVNLGVWSEADLAQVVSEASKVDSPGDRIVELSLHFLYTPYAANTLIGDPQTEEKLVINLAGFDCFTFLDVIESLRRVSGLDDFHKEIKQVRYRDGKVSYDNRRHFFSDWVADDDAKLTDVTAKVAKGKVRVASKKLNLKSDGTLWLPEIAVVPREISYIPTETIDSQILSSLRAGDYVGIYSKADGLDVTHTGLIVKEGDTVMLRHASSSEGVRRVVDVELTTYLQSKPGLVVYRVRQSPGR